MNNELEEGKEKGGGGSSTVSKFDKQPQLKIFIELDLKVDLFMFHMLFAHTYTLLSVSSNK